jgi:hypothetical protein
MQTSSPSMGEVSRAKRVTEGVLAQPMKEKPPEAVSEPAADLTPSVTLRVTAPPLRGSVKTRGAAFIALTLSPIWVIARPLSIWPPRLHG